MRLLAYALFCLTSLAGCQLPPEAYLVHPKVHFVFWGDWDAAGYTDRWTRLLQGPVLDRLAEYGNKGATLEGPFYQQTTNVPVDTIPGSVNEDATIPATLEDYFHKGTIPAPSGEDVYVVFLPPGTTTKLFQLEGAVGAHTASVYNGTWYTYAIIRDVHADLTLSHELYESITDPYGTGWHNGPQQEEIGDMCDPFDPAIGTDTFGDTTVQKLWSAKAGACL